MSSNNYTLFNKYKCDYANREDRNEIIILTDVSFLHPIFLNNEESIDTNIFYGNLFVDEKNSAAILLHGRTIYSLRYLSKDDKPKDNPNLINVKPKVVDEFDNTENLLWKNKIMFDEINFETLIKELNKIYPPLMELLKVNHELNKQLSENKDVSC
jgi:hypothetical protein